MKLMHGDILVYKSNLFFVLNPSRLVYDDGSFLVLVQNLEDSGDFRNINSTYHLDSGMWTRYNNQTKEN
jgi:hypothetical protein